MTPEDAILLLLLIGMIYLIYRVNRLERLVTGGAARRSKPLRRPDGGKVIPILKEHIEPGPFRPDPPKVEKPKPAPDPES